jgi:hypothetical protein
MTWVRRSLSKDARFPQFAAQIGSPTPRWRGRYAVPDPIARSPCPANSRTIRAINGRKLMQIDLYQTLKSINVADDQAKLVVGSLEDHIDDVVRDATKPLQEKLDGLHRSLETHMKTQTWVISVIVFALTAIGTLVTILRH